MNNKIVNFRHNEPIGKETLQFFIDYGIIDLDDVLSLSEDTLMNKILKEVHPYDIYFSSDNRWHTYISDPTNIHGRKSVVRKNKNDLEKFLLNYYHLQLNNEIEYTFENLWVEFMKYKDATQKSGTIEAYVKSYKRFYKDDAISKRNLASIDVVELRMWLMTNIKKYKLDYKAYNKMSVVLNQMYKYAIEKKYLQDNPFDKIQVKNLGLYNSKKKNSSERAFSKTETKDINQITFNDFVDNPNCTALGILLIFQTGLRICELLGLKWSDIDYKNKTITIRRMENMVQDHSDDYRTLTNCGHAVVENTKGQYGERVVDLTDDALYILQLLKDFHEDKHFKTEWLFVGNNGQKSHYRGYDKKIRRYCRMSGMDMEKSLHKIRSTYISMLRDAGMSFEKIKELVGHKDVFTTMQNYSYDVREDEENKQILNNCLNIRTKTA